MHGQMKSTRKLTEVLKDPFALQEQVTWSSSLYFCSEHYQVLEVLVNMALFENSDITLLRYNSGIFFWSHFIAADIQKNTSIKKGENIFILTSLQFYERVLLSFVLQILWFPQVFKACPSSLVFISFLMYLKESKSLSLWALFYAVYPKSFTATARETISYIFSKWKSSFTPKSVMNKPQAEGKVNHVCTGECRKRRFNTLQQ